jgi:membrane peptidoglycan carboxypeptidase
MAFGQEIAATPLQVLNAYAAVANGGVMMMPRLVRGVADPRTGEVARSEPVVVRRVVEEETARRLREFCLRVVEDGTAQAAKVGFMKVAGKTGTAQKAGLRGYIFNRYVSSFVGFAPYENPRIACLVLIDEPAWRVRYGGDSAAPAFARICESLASSTDVFDDLLTVERLRLPVDGGRRARTPNFLRMERALALETARRGGTNVLCSGGEGRVVAQAPAPGTPLDRDGVVRLVVSDGKIDGRRARAGLEMNKRLRESYHGVAAPGGGSPAGNVSGEPRISRGDEAGADDAVASAAGPRRAVRRR